LKAALRLSLFCSSASINNNNINNNNKSLSQATKTKAYAIETAEKDKPPLAFPSSSALYVVLEAPNGTCTTAYNGELTLWISNCDSSIGGRTLIFDILWPSHRRLDRF
jgi:hypothetical protein